MNSYPREIVSSEVSSIQTLRLQRSWEDSRRAKTFSTACRLNYHDGGGDRAVSSRDCFSYDVHLNPRWTNSSLIYSRELHSEKILRGSPTRPLTLRRTQSEVFLIKDAGWHCSYCFSDLAHFHTFEIPSSRAGTGPLQDTFKSST